MNDKEFAKRLVEAHRSMMTEDELMDEKIHFEACDVFDEIGEMGMTFSEFLGLAKEEQDKIIIPQIRDCAFTEERIERIKQKMVELFKEDLE